MTPTEGVAVSLRVAPAKALESETIDAVIDSLLGADPPPHVFAMDETGLCVPLPSQIPVDSEHAISGVRSGLELCLQTDLPAMVETWERARVQRGAQVTVHLRREPERAVTLHIVDARHRFGVYLGILVGSHGSPTSPGGVPLLFRPRVCSMQRDELSIIRAIDAATTQILGWTEAELIGGRTLDLVHLDDRALAIANWMEMLGRPGFDQRVVMRYRHRDGNYIWFEITHRNLLNDPASGLVQTEMVDVSERMEAVAALSASEQLLRRLTEALPIGIGQIDAGRRIVYRNELLLELLGTVVVETLDEQFAAIVPSDRGLFAGAVGAVLNRGEGADVELTIGPRRCAVALRALSAPGGAITGAIICVTDVTDRVRLREELERRARYDMLTRCHNRTSILELLEGILTSAKRAQNGLAVVFVDLDHFKGINDRFGHAAGDQLLRVTGARLLESVRAGDLVGRLGGDEFLIVCPDVATTELALEIAHRIAASLSQTVVVGTISISPGSSIGVAWTDHAVACDTIVATADEAMYQSKREACGPVLAMR